MKKRKTLLLGILVLNLVACAKNLPTNISDQNVNSNSQVINNQVSNTNLTSSNISKSITTSVAPNNVSNTVITSKVAPVIVLPSTTTQNTLTTQDSDVDEETKDIDVKDALVSYQDIDSIFLESENLSSSSQDKILSSSFGVKSLIQNDIRFDSNKSNQQIDLRESIITQLKQIRDTKIKQDTQMSNSNQKKLENKQIITNNTYQKVDFHYKSEVKDSDEVVLDNNDGTTIKDKEFEFNRDNITRVNRTSKTYQKNTNNLTKLEHHFSAKHVNYIQEATRLISFDNLGGRVINTECTTKFNDGKMTVLSERKTIDRFGNGIGLGLIKVIYVSGKTFSYDFNISSTGLEQKCNVKNDKDTREIEVIRDNKGKARVKCNNETKVIDIDDEVNNYNPPIKPSHSPKPTSIPTVTPVATPTPTATSTPIIESTVIPSPEVTPTVTPTPIIEPTVTPSPEVTPTTTPVPTSAPSNKGNNGLGDTKDDDNETKGEDSSNPGHN